MEENMEELYLETKNGNVPIDEDTIEKYDLKKGSLSPFTRNRIVGRNGEYYLKSDIEEALLKQSFNKMPEEGFHDDGIAHMEDGFELSTSEMIDISQGLDSD